MMSMGFRNFENSAGLRNGKQRGSPDPYVYLVGVTVFLPEVSSRDKCHPAGGFNSSAYLIYFVLEL